jgi:hypothetical protein
LTDIHGQLFKTVPGRQITLFTHHRLIGSMSIMKGMLGYLFTT